MRDSECPFYPRGLERGACSDLDEAKRTLADIVEKYAKPQSKLSAWMKDNIPEGLTVFAFPAAVRQFLRTSNTEENPNGQNMDPADTRVTERRLAVEAGQRYLRGNQRRLGDEQLPLHVDDQGTMSTERIYRQNPCVISVIVQYSVSIIEGSRCFGGTAPRNSCHWEARTLAASQTPFGDLVLVSCW